MKEILYHTLVFKDVELIRVPVFGIRKPVEAFSGKEGHDAEPFDFQEDRADGSASYSGNKIGLHDMTEF